MNQEARERSERIKQKEIERKFLISAIPPEIALGILRKKYFSEDIEQGYLPDESRVRRSTTPDGKVHYTHTKKTEIPDSDGMAKDEETAHISKKKFGELWKLTEGERIKKKRYYVKFGVHTIHLDMFEGDSNLNGRVIAEVEFKSLKAARSFKPPEWFGPDITYISNRKLALGLQQLPPPVALV